MTGKALPAKQQAFCEEYLIDLNATQAAIRAGYSEKTANRIASKLLTKIDIQKRIGELKEQRSKKTGITAEWVLNASVDLYNKCMEAERVKDKDGNDMGFAKFNAAGAGKAIELVGKHVNIQAFSERQEVEVTAPKAIEFVVVKPKEKNAD